MLIVKHIELDIDVLVSNDTCVNVKSVNFVMSVTAQATGSVKGFTITADIIPLEIEEASFSVTSYIGDIGKTKDELEPLVFYLVQYLGEHLSEEINIFNLRQLLPEDF